MPEGFAVHLSGSSRDSWRGQRGWTWWDSVCGLGIHQVKRVTGEIGHVTCKACLRWVEADAVRRLGGNVLDAVPSVRSPP